MTDLLNKSNLKTWHSKYDIKDRVMLIIQTELHDDPDCGIITGLQFNEFIPQYRITWGNATSSWHYEYEVQLAETKVNK